MRSDRCEKYGVTSCDGCPVETVCKKEKRMKITIEIPEEFEADWNYDRFEETLLRLRHDAHLIAGRYEKETAEMLIDAFKNATVNEGEDE